MKHFLTRWLPRVEWLGVFFLTLISALGLSDPKNYSEPWRTSLTLVEKHRLVVIFVLSAAVLASKIGDQVIERWTADRRDLKGVLDAVHKAYFADIPEEELYLNRVTLFKASRAWLLWRKELKIFERSGTAFRRSKTRFRLNDEEERLNEAVAGRAWFINAQISVVGLPEWPENPNPNVSSDPICVEYSQRGSLSPIKAKLLNVKSRSVGATVVRDRNGQRWGVLVVDSRDPSGVSDLPERNRLIALAADLITRML